MSDARERKGVDTQNRKGTQPLQHCPDQRYRPRFRCINTGSALSASAFLVAPVLADLVVKHSVDGLKITSDVTNDSTEGITLVDHPNSVVGSQYETDVFKFESEGGNTPEFNGITLKWNPAVAEKFILGPGETKTFVQDVTELYDFSKSGESTYTVSGGSAFYSISPESVITPQVATVVSSTAKISGAQAARKRNYNPVYNSYTRRATAQGCSVDQATKISQAANAAQNYIQTSLAYTSSITGPTERFTWWFGTYDAGRKALVMDHFSKMLNDATGAATSYDCSTCLRTSNAGAYAYVYPTQPYRIYLCKAFWNAPMTGTDSKAGTIVHELSHFNENGGTKDYVYGQAKAHELGLSTPANAVMNADSHEYYAENMPFLS